MSEKLLPSELPEPEVYPFPGIDEETRAALRAVDEEFPGFVTPVDVLVARMEVEGVKIVFGTDPESGNVFVLPALSGNVRDDSLLPRHLNVVEDMDPRLKTLILDQKVAFDLASERDE